ncbi:PREDICTED: AP-5 complex subunit beta-1 isoform X2 [Ipomoea nil]|uniref:AP-5 complex subunit beta-1 isoform X2 n=1 Tax=Ipomoea nil TaxID=35883 RepID=UPI000901B970|nr:PREDICTED: AP-5 complex subunit beta-1 isoform X2 [Ipomoea nil]
MSSHSQLKPLSPQEWESLIDDYNHGGARLFRWTAAHYSGTLLFELALSSVVRKDLPLNLKLQLLIFLEEHSSTVIPSAAASASASFSRLIDTLRSVVQSPNDGVSITFPLKEQFLISTTSIFVTTNANGDSGSNTISSGLVPHFEGLIELLLTIINRPNHSVDRQTRSVTCDCLRELEIAFPCLLSDVASQLWALSQSERTHAGQSYALLLATVVANIVKLKPNASFTNASMPLVPFNVPSCVIDDADNNATGEDKHSTEKQISDLSNKDLKRVVAFLLEWPHNLTPWGLLEFMDKILPVAAALDLQASLLKVQFSGLLSTYDPLLWHAYLAMCLRFLDSFEGQELEIARRLLLLSKESQHHLVFRLLALHWLLGFVGLVLNRDEGKRGNVLEMSLSFYPAVFDPLALKSLKIDLLAYCSILVIKGNGVVSTETSPKVSVEKLFEDALVSVSAFKWLPPWSTETAVAFRAFHKFLIGASSHSEADSVSNRILTESTIFHTVQTLVASMSEYKGMVPVTVTFIDRLLACHKHHLLGEHLLKTFDEHLLPKLKLDYRLGSYFPILEKMAMSSKVSPSGLLELLVKFMLFLIEKHGPDTGLRSWCHGSKVLGICRTMLMHHHSSKLFLGLSRLLAFTCLYFPDLEVRDNARIYLRMLICIPGKKLRDILNSGDQLPGVSPSTHSSPFFTVQSPRFSHDLKKSRNISSYIHIERVIPLLVKQSWSLSLATLGIHNKKPGYLEAIRDTEPMSEHREIDRNNDQSVSETYRTDLLPGVPEPLLVMDSKICQIVEMLRRHFSSIPDFRHMPGLRIKIPCSLWFESEPFNRIWGSDMAANEFDGVDALPAIYAAVLRFSSSAPYGSIPSYHIPFLLGQPPRSFNSFNEHNSLEIVPVDNSSYSPGEVEGFNTHVMIELEPREPVPSLVDIFIEANTVSGQIIQGQLRSISVGIEDMFLKAIPPDDISGEAVPDYYVQLFNALWEACGTSTSTGRETFVLKGGKGVAAISGTRSVKLLEIPAASLIQSVERCLAPFVVCVTGELLINIVKGGGVIRDIVWGDTSPDSSIDDVSTQETSVVGGPLYLKYLDDEDDRGGNAQFTKKNMGCFQILIFLPPRFHLLFQMEVCDTSSLVRIRTDHWPCLAYIDDYLEALFCL